ncbi:hypothetical protein ACQ4PT_050475 [Festuca glaucescens]
MIQEAVAVALAAQAQKQSGVASGPSEQPGGKQPQAVIQVQQPLAPTLGAQQGAEVPVIISETNHQTKKAKKAEKQGCFRCKQTGHLIDDCIVPVCDNCLMFCECPTTGTFQPKVDNAKLAKGFYKLDFIVEPKLVSQEATMVDAQDGVDGDKDGNGGHDEHGKNGIDMDMDTLSKSENQNGNNMNQPPALVGGGEAFSNLGQAHMGVVSPIKFGKFERFPALRDDSTNLPVFDDAVLARERFAENVACTTIDVDAPLGLSPVREEMSSSESGTNLHAPAVSPAAAVHEPVPAAHVLVDATRDNMGTVPRAADHAVASAAVAEQCMPTKGLAGLPEGISVGRET